MPNTNPIFRAMDWGYVLHSLPNEISYFLPSGDPLDNKKEIKKEIERFKFGPEVRYQMHLYTKGEITDEEFESNVDKIISEYDKDKLEEFNTNLSIIENGLQCSLYEKYLPFFKTIDLKNNEVKKAIYNINNISFLYERKNKELLKENNK